HCRMEKIDFLSIDRDERAKIFQAITNTIPIPAYAVEKDWWVVQVLSVVFQMDVGRHLVFKGGTSLSKAWQLIQRFSEDIDLAIDRAHFGFNGDLSNSQ